MIKGEAPLNRFQQAADMTSGETRQLDRDRWYMCVVGQLLSAYCNPSPSSPIRSKSSLGDPHLTHTWQRSEREEMSLLKWLSSGKSGRGTLVSSYQKQSNLINWSGSLIRMWWIGLLVARESGRAVGLLLAQNGTAGFNLGVNLLKSKHSIKIDQTFNLRKEYLSRQLSYAKACNSRLLIYKICRGHRTITKYCVI